MESVVWGLIGTLVGALTSIGTTWISSRNASSLQNSAAQLEREERHRSFQRDTCVELQDALHGLLRMSARAQLEDKKAFVQGGAWGKQQLSDEVNEGESLAIRRVVILKERISDDALRSDITNLLEKLGRLTLANSPHEAENLEGQIISDGIAVMEHIGKVLRGQYFVLKSKRSL
jgi:hypothetical protein